MDSRITGHLFFILCFLKSIQFQAWFNDFCITIIMADLAVTHHHGESSKFYEFSEPRNHVYKLFVEQNFHRTNISDREFLVTLRNSNTNIPRNNQGSSKESTSRNDFMVHDYRAESSSLFYNWIQLTDRECSKWLRPWIQGTLALHANQYSIFSPMTLICFTSITACTRFFYHYQLSWLALGLNRDKTISNF